MEMKILDTLRDHVLTRALSEDEQEYVASLGRVVCYLPGTFIFHESQPRREFGIVRSGSIEIRKGAAKNSALAVRVTDRAGIVTDYTVDRWD